MCVCVRCICRGAWCNGRMWQCEDGIIFFSRSHPLFILCSHPLYIYVYIALNLVHTRGARMWYHIKRNGFHYFLVVSGDGGGANWLLLCVRCAHSKSFARDDMCVGCTKSTAYICCLCVRRRLCTTCSIFFYLPSRWLLLPRTRSALSPSDIGIYIYNAVSDGERAFISTAMELD